MYGNGKSEVTGGRPRLEIWPRGRVGCVRGGWGPACPGSCTECLPHTALSYNYLQDVGEVRLIPGQGAGLTEWLCNLERGVSSVSGSTTSACSPSPAGEQFGVLPGQGSPSQFLAQHTGAAVQHVTDHRVHALVKRTLEWPAVCFDICVMGQAAGAVMAGSLHKTDFNPVLLGQHRAAWGWLWVFTATAGSARSTSREKLKWLEHPLILLSLEDRRIYRASWRWHN